MRSEQPDDTALRVCSPERLIALIARVRPLIEAVTSYRRCLAAVAEQGEAACAVGDVSTHSYRRQTCGFRCVRQLGVPVCG